jgi:hypothetical protein
VWNRKRQCVCERDCIRMKKAGKWIVQVYSISVPSVRYGAYSAGKEKQTGVVTLVGVDCN